MTTKTHAKARASGKVILFGEHAVVYGTNAIAAGIDRGAVASVERKPHGPSALRIGTRTVTADRDAKDDLAAAFAALLDTKPALPAMHVEARSDLPPGGGLGSSAALAVAIARAAEALEGESANDASVLERAAAWERVFHGNPSGIDATAAAKGGIFRYARADGATPIEPGADFLFCVGSTGQPSSTRTTVELIASRRERDPALVERSIAAIASIVGNAILAIEAGDHRAVGDLMNMNQHVLSGLFVSTSELEDLCAIARGAGALGAKLTGGGGGGCVIALVAPVLGPLGEHDEAKEAENADKILNAWLHAEGRYEGFATRIPAAKHAHPSKHAGENP